MSGGRSKISLWVPPVGELDEERALVVGRAERLADVAAEVEVPRVVEVRAALRPDEVGGRAGEVLPAQDGVTPERLEVEVGVPDGEVVEAASVRVDLVAVGVGGDRRVVVHAVPVERIGPRLLE